VLTGGQEYHTFCLASDDTRRNETKATLIDN